MKKLKNLFHHFTIPSRRNNYRAKMLHLDALIVVLGLITVFSLTTHYASESGVLGIAKDITIERLLELTNQERASQGLPPLRYNNNLAHAAQNKAQHMFTHDYWAHFGAGKSPWDFILESGYSYEVAGENLAKGFYFSDSVVEGWKNSPTHYENIIRPDYDEVGFAVMNGVLQGEETTLVVQMFGRQIAQAAPVQDKEATQVAEEQQEPEAVAAVEDDTALPDDTDSSGASAEEPAVADLEAIAEAEAESQPVVASSFISINALKFNWTFMVIGVLLLILTVDLYFAHKLDLVRLSGKSIAHIIFLSALVMGLMVIKNGVIL